MTCEISAFSLAIITASRGAGHSDHEISEILDIPRSSIVRIVHRYQEIGTVENRPRSGRLNRLSSQESLSRYISTCYIDADNSRKTPSCRIMC